MGPGPAAPPSHSQEKNMLRARHRMSAGQGVRLVLFVLAASLSPPSLLRADELHVGAGAQFATIQAAIDAAVDGRDSILVLPGTYAEAIDFKGKKIRVFSQNGPGTTTIDATTAPKNPVVAFRASETTDSILEGFTITGGTGFPLSATSQGGGGIFVDKASPTIRNCVITKNS